MEMTVTLDLSSLLAITRMASIVIIRHRSSRKSPIRVYGDRTRTVKLAKNKFVSGYI